MSTESPGERMGRQTPAPGRGGDTAGRCGLPPPGSQLGHPSPIEPTGTRPGPSVGYWMIVLALRYALVWALSTQVFQQVDGLPVRSPHDPDPVSGDSQEEGCHPTVWSWESQAGVSHLSTRCSEGVVSWHHPQGALRITFLPPVAAKTGPLLETCFTLTSRRVSAVVALETVDGDGEGLKPLEKLDAGHPDTDDETCIRSATPITIYVEIPPGGDNLALGYINVQYDVITVDPEDDEMDACRPCTDSELLLAVCSMDFVVVGGMRTVHHDADTPRTTIDIGVTKILRHNADLFDTPLAAGGPANDGSLQEPLQGTVHAPRRCGVRRGEGQFLFVGRVRLGRPLLQCAPRLETFQEVWSEAIRQNLNPCTLD